MARCRMLSAGSLNQLGLIKLGRASWQLHDGKNRIMI
jgi:hypothetical protein